jgi:hypothetical protein
VIRVVLIGCVGIVMASLHHTLHTTTSRYIPECWLFIALLLVAGFLSCVFVHFSVQYENGVRPVAVIPETERTELVTPNVYRKMTE